MAERKTPQRTKPFTKEAHNKRKAEFLAALESKLEDIRLSDELSKSAKLREINKLELQLLKYMPANHISFVEEWQKDFNMSAAGLRAGFSESYVKSAGGIARNETIQQFMNLVKIRKTIALEVTADFVVSEFLNLAKVKASDLYDADGRLIPPHKLPANIATAVQKVKEKRTILAGGAEIVEFEYTLHSKVASLDALGKHTGIYERDNKQKANDVGAQVVYYLPDNGRAVVAETAKK